MERKTVKATAQIHRDLQSSERRYSTEDILIHTNLWRNRCGSFAQGLKGAMKKRFCTLKYIMYVYNENAYAIFVDLPLFLGQQCNLKGTVCP